MSDIGDLVTAALSGSRGALARLLSIAELNDGRLTEIEDRISPLVGNALVVGVTGPPGAGKSTLINALVPLALTTFDSVAVLAVDPSSPFSDGAILGDRVRMQGGQHGTRVFIRSMASRGEFGGLARAASTATRLFDACQWPLIIIETLGIGQVELDIMNLADTTAVVLNPGWGDAIQANKAGLTEAGNVFVINKADKPGVDQTRADLLDSLSLLAVKPRPEVVDCTATGGQGVDEVWRAIQAHLEFLVTNGELALRREIRRRRVVRNTITNQLNQLVDRLMASELGEALVADATLGELDLTDTIRQLLNKLPEMAALSSPPGGHHRAE